MSASPTHQPRSRTLALKLMDSLAERIREGRLAAGEKLPTEAEIMAEYGVSRTVVREAIGRLAAGGLVETRHGIGTFVVGIGDGAAFRVAPQQLETLRDVIALLELRIGIETEAAALAAQRRTEPNLAAMRAALDAFGQAVEQGHDAVAADFQFHSEIARATQNDHFARLMGTLGSGVIPRARLANGEPPNEERLAYLKRVNAEHESILDAIASGDPDAARAAMTAHLANSRERRRRAAGA